jgi:hypothetical protein
MFFARYICLLTLTHGTQLLSCHYYTSYTGDTALYLHNYTSPHMIRLLDTLGTMLYFYEIRLPPGCLTSPWPGANY